MTSRLSIPIGRALTWILLLAVLSTAGFVHLVWHHAARENIDRAVSNLTTGATLAISRELSSSFQAAEATAEIIRSALFQGTISAEDEAKREFLFLSVLRSQPAIAWIGFGFPDGRFFGAHASGNKIRMVEIGGEAGAGRSLRVDVYQPLPGDIFFEARHKGTSQYVTSGSGWYRAALSETEPAWTTAELLPSGFEPSIVVSKRVERFGEFTGIVMIAIAHERISGLLSELEIARAGRALVLDETGRIVADSAPRGGGSAANVADIADDDRLGELVRDSMAQGEIESSRITETGDEAGTVYISAVPLNLRDWRLVTAIPRSYFAKEIDRAGRKLPFVVAALALLAAIASALFVNLLIVAPLRHLSGELTKVEQFRLSEITRLPSYLAEIDAFSNALGKMAVGLDAFGRYIPVDVVRGLVRSGKKPQPGGEVRPVTVLFADLPGFTEMSEILGAEIEGYLTSFLTIAVEAIEAECGTVDKFIGDEVMAIWNAPGDIPDHAERACHAATRIATQLHSISLPEGVSAKGGPRVRIGINTGNAIVGNVGSRRRLSYTAIGDTVNLASRLVGIAKEHSVEIIASQATRDAVGCQAAFHPLGSVAVRGRKGSVTAFSLNRQLLPLEAPREVAQ